MDAGICNVGLGQENVDELDPMEKKYLRGDGVNLEVLLDKKLKGQLSFKEKLYGQSARAAAMAEKWLLPTDHGYLEAEGLEKTWRIKQETILQEVDIISSRKPFDMVMKDLGPYKLGYTLNGRYMLVGGRKGHLALIDMITMDLIKEFQVRETVRDVVFLHNEHFFAVAQKKYPYIYNRHGTEIHCLKEHGAPLKLQFLEKHFLLASINKFGQLHYQDVSTGEIVGNFRTGLGRTGIMQMNPYNAVVTLGHAGGKITMWKPTSCTPLVTMLCHHGPVTALAFHPSGHLMATAGIDRKIKLWDIRKFQVLKAYSGYAQSLDFSQKGLLALSNGSQVQIWRDSNHTDYQRYMSHSMVKGFQVGKLCFRPYEDVLGIGHSMGISSILIPGSGEPNFDSWVANPYETNKQGREKELHSLLDKLQPETIMLDPSRIGTVRPQRRKEKTNRRKEAEAQLDVVVEKAKSIVFKNKTKGRSKPSRRAKKKEEAVLNAKRSHRENHHQVEEESSLKRRKIIDGEAELPKALQRFARKKASIT